MGTELTHRERLMALLADFHITPMVEPGFKTVMLEAGKGGVGGYSGFFAEFQFSNDGAFESVSVWE